MSQNYTIKTLTSKNDAHILKPLFDEIFLPEEVGDFAENLFRHFPYTKPEYWFIAEEESTSQYVAGLTLIPWSLNMQGIELKTAEMGIVGTLESHRSRGLIRKLSAALDEVCTKENFDLQIIQGIPGFYQRLGYHYAIPLDNHINLPLHVIEDNEDESEFKIRGCEKSDIPFLMSEEKQYNEKYFISSMKREAHWQYILKEACETECASELYILEKTDDSEKYYFRINLMGFGSGLIISEVSEDIPDQCLKHLFAYCKKLAIEREKPYVRLNLSAASSAALRAFSMGAVQAGTYGFQVKITEPVKFLHKIKPVLEERIKKSRFRFFKGVFTLSLYTQQFNFHFDDGNITEIAAKSEETELTVSIPEDLLAPLILGFRTWKELQHIRPDVYIEDHRAGEFLDILFPKEESWINCQY